MALVRFDQEPGYPDGTGMFHADDGSSFFAHDPEMAASIGPYGPPQEDERTASWASDMDAVRRSIPGQDADYAGGQQRPMPPPVATDAPASGSDNAKIQQALFHPEAAPTQPATAAPQESPALGQAEQLQSAVDAYVPQYKQVAGSPGGVRPVTQQEVREMSGVPYNEEDAADRANVSINKAMAYSGQQRAQAARSAGEAAAWQAAVPELEEKARVAQMRRDMQERQYRRDREDLEAAMEQSNKSARSFDANRWFNERGAVGQIGAAIAQAFGAGAAALTGGPNVVLQQINSYIDRDIATQRAQIEADEKGANNALAQLNRQYGNLDQAEAALRIAQQNKVETMAKSYAASTKSEDIMKALDVWLAENAEKRLATEQQFQNAAYGKTSLTTAAKVIPATRGGVVPLTEKEKQEYLQTLSKRNEVIGGTYETEMKRLKASGMDPEKADKINALVIENLDGSQVLAKSKEEGEKIRAAKALHTGAVREFEQIKKVAQESATGGRAGEAKGRIRVLMKRALERGNTMAGQGVFRTDDADYYTDALIGAGGGVRAEVIDELTGMLDHEYQSLVDSQRGSSVRVSETNSGQKVNYTGKSSKTPSKAANLSQFEVGTK